MHFLLFFSLRFQNQLINLSVYLFNMGFVLFFFDEECTYILYSYFLAHTCVLFGRRAPVYFAFLFFQQLFLFIIALIVTSMDLSSLFFFFLLHFVGFFFRSLLSEFLMFLHLLSPPICILFLNSILNNMHTSRQSERENV